MPRQFWKHACRKTGRAWSQSAPFRCWRCLRRAEPDGWHRSMHEAMFDYQRSRGLKPIGPHRRLTDEAFAGAFRPCRACGGRGVLDGGEPDACALCLPCDGRGFVAAVTDDELERRRALVLERFPDAACDRVRFSSPPHDGALPAASASAGPVFVAPRHARATSDTPDWVTLVRAVFFVLVLAPGWLFGSIWAFRGGRWLVGTVLLFASSFAALSGLMMASPSSFGRTWVWVWGAVAAGLILFLALAVGQAACAG